jgi:hypothetical protein
MGCAARVLAPAALVGGDRPQALQALGERLDRERDRMPCVAVSDGSPERRIRHTADPNRRRARGPGRRPHAREPRVRAFMGGQVRAPGAQRGQAVVGDRGAPVERDAERVEFALRPPESDAERRQPTTGEVVDGPDDPCGVQRVLQGQQHHRRPQFDLRRHGCEPAECRRRVEERGGIALGDVTG